MVSSFFCDLKRAWRLTKLIRASELSDEDALQIEKVDAIYLEECRELKTKLDKARKSLNRALKNWKTSNNKRLSEMEDSLVTSVTGISQLLESSQQTLSKRLGQVEQSSATTMELVDNVREYVSKQANETRRWQEGYDWRILKNYLLRVISTIDEVEDKMAFYRSETKPEDFLNDFDFLREALEIHLEEEGLMSYTPSLGAEPDVSKEEVKASITVETEDQEAGSIAEIIRKGYEIDLGAETKVVRKAQVSVYKK